MVILVKWIEIEERGFICPLLHVYIVLLIQ